MKKYKIYGFSILSFVLIVSACLPKDHLKFDGPSMVEFKNQTLGLNNLQGALTNRGIVTNDASLTQTASARGIFLNSKVVDTIYVQLVGPHRSADTQVAFSVSSESTAVEGQHFNFKPAKARTVTIPANSSVGYILTEPVENSLTTVGEIKTIILNLDENQDPKPSVNYATFKLSLKR